MKFWIVGVIFFEKHLNEPNPREVCKILKLIWKWTKYWLTSRFARLSYDGLFIKFCYERLSIRKNNVCLTDFVHKYSSFFYTYTWEISKESSNYQ